MAVRGHAHLLLRVAGGWRGASETRFCNGCRRHTAEAFRETAPGAPREHVVMHACAECDYDLCVACTARMLPVPFVVAPAAPLPPPGDNTVDPARFIVRFGRWRLTRHEQYTYAWTDGATVRLYEFPFNSNGWYRFATAEEAAGQRVVYGSGEVSSQELAGAVRTISSLPRPLVAADLATAEAAVASRVAATLSAANGVVTVEQRDRFSDRRALRIHIVDIDVRLFADGSAEATARSGERVGLASFAPL